MSFEVEYDGSRFISDEERKELAAYIEENSYCNIDSEKGARVEKEWDRLPQEREERALLALMKKQLLRKEADEKAYGDFLKRKEKCNNSSDDVSFHLGFVTPESLKSYMNDGGYESFNVVFNRFREEHNAGRDADICRKANLRQDTLSKLRKEAINPSRDYLWALAIALTLNKDETEELFNSCGLSTYGGFRLQETEEKRERVFEFAINKQWGIKTVNKVLEENKLLTLGNFMVG